MLYILNSVRLIKDNWTHYTKLDRYKLTAGVHNFTAILE